MMMLNTWLTDASGNNVRSLWYTMTQVIVQMLISLQVGLLYALYYELLFTMNYSSLDELLFTVFTTVRGLQVGLLYAHPFAPTSFGTCFQLTVLASLLLVVTIWTAHGAANDRLEGYNATLCYAMELAATVLLLTAALITEPGNRDSTMTALKLVEYSVDILFWAIFVPMLLTVYDSFVMPIIVMIWKAEGSRTEILIQLVVTCVLLPLEVASSFFGGSSSVSDLAAGLEDAALEMAANAVLLEDDEAIEHYDEMVQGNILLADEEGDGGEVEGDGREEGEGIMTAATNEGEQEGDGIRETGAGVGVELG